MGTLRRSTIANFLVAGIIAGLSISSTACGTTGAASAPKSGGPEATAVAVEASQAREQRIALAEQVVRNGRYELPGIGAFQLRDGNYQEKYGDGATQVNRVGVVTVSFGDLDGDGVEDAAVVLWANTGGSGTFIYLVPVLNEDGKGQQAGVQMLGDRVQIKSIAINSGKINLEVLSQGAADPMVSPSLQSVQEYTLKDGKLVMLTPAGSSALPALKPTQQPPAQSAQPSSTPAPRSTQQPTSQPAQAAPSGIAGTVWTWQRFVDNGDKGGFAVPYPPAYRLELLPDGKYSIQADCNKGSGDYTLEGNRLELKPGPMTLAECQQGSKSRQFLQMLPQIATYVLKGDVLYLNLKADGGDMVFTQLSAITGRIVAPAGDVAPAGGTAEIMLVDNAGKQIGGSIVKAQFPMEFEAPFKPANIEPSAAYTLEVTIRDAQKNVVFKNSRPYRVLTQGNPTYHVEVAIERVP